MKKEQFLKETGLTENQFYGRVKIEGLLDLDRYTSIPEGFSPTVVRSLLLNSLTYIPKGFNPTVGSSLWLNGLTSITEGFNLTVGGSLILENVISITGRFNPTVGKNLWLDNLTSILDGFNPTVGWNLYLGSHTSIYEGFNLTNIKGHIYINGNQYKFMKNRFYGQVEIENSLDLDNLTSIPKGYSESQRKLLEIYQKYPNLTLNNKGYEEIDRSKLTTEDKEAIKEVEDILKNNVKGFHRFQNFKDSSGKVVIRCQADYNYDNRNPSFIGDNYNKSIPSFIGVLYIGLDFITN